MEQTRYDVFISYSSKDQKIAEGICGYLESNGFRCFVAYRDIPRGIVWAAAITEAIEECAVMVVVFSQHFNCSEQTDREIELAANAKIPILTYRISDAKFERAKKYYLQNLNWIDAFPNPESYFGVLLKSVTKLQRCKESFKELFNQGLDFYFGRNGKEQNYKEAVGYFKKAADGGYATAQFFWGSCYLQGNGVSKDQEKATFWLEKASDQGIPIMELFVSEMTVNLFNYC